MSTEAVARLKKTLKAADDPFGESSVIRWVVEVPSLRSEVARPYTFVALKVSNHWYLTGTGTYYGTTRMTYRELTEVLGRSEVVEVSVATIWEVVL